MSEGGIYLTYNKKDNIATTDLSKYYKKYIGQGGIFKIVLNSKIDFSKAGWEKQLTQIFINTKTGFTNPTATYTWVKNNMPDFYKECCYNESREISEIRSAIYDKHISFFNKDWNKKVFDIISNMDREIKTQADSCFWMKKNMPEFFGYETIFAEGNEKNINEARKCIVNNLSDDFAKNKNANNIVGEIIQIPLSEINDWLKKNIPNFYSRAFVSKKPPTKEEIVRYSDIDYSKEHWEYELFESLNMSPEDTRKWVKENMPEFYYNNCFNEHTIANRKIDLILKSNVDITKRNWHIELSRLINDIPKNTFYFVRDYMPDFYKKCYFDPKLGNNGMITVHNYVQILFEAKINFYDYGWDKQTAYILNTTVENAREFIRTKLPFFYNVEYFYDKKPVVEQYNVNDRVLVSSTYKDSNMYKDTIYETPTYNESSIIEDTDSLGIPNDENSNSISNNISNNSIHDENISNNSSKKSKKINEVIQERNRNAIITFNEQPFTNRNKSEFEKRRNIIMNCDIDFSKYGWKFKLAELMDSNPAAVTNWLANNMPKFYNEYCNIYNYQYPNKNKRLLNKRKKIIEKSNIDFSKKGWSNDLAKLFNLNNPTTAYNWVKRNLPDFFKNNCWKLGQKNNDDGVVQSTLEDVYNAQEVTLSPVEKRKEIILNANIDYSKKGWGTELGKILNISASAALIWVKENMPDFYEENCFKQRSSNEITNKRKELIRTCDINFGDYGWSIHLGKLLNLSPISASAWLRSNMPDFYESKCRKGTNYKKSV
jgi:hypothetical protein